jgi:hypothetical protein
MCCEQATIESVSREVAVLSAVQTLREFEARRQDFTGDIQFPNRARVGAAIDTVAKWVEEGMEKWVRRQK